VPRALRLAAHRAVHALADLAGEVSVYNATATVKKVIEAPAPPAAK
jgi:uncharacterized protein (UPF0147 family)